MIWYKAKNSILHPRYNDWAIIRSQHQGTSDFSRFNIKLEDTVYTENSETFQKHLKKLQMWEKLADKG